MRRRSSIVMALAGAALGYCGTQAIVTGSVPFLAAEVLVVGVLVVLVGASLGNWR